MKITQSITKGDSPKLNNTKKTYLISILIPLLTGLISALLTSSNISLYYEINRPFLAPPTYIFPIVWSVLYTLMGISFAKIALSDNAEPSLKKFVYTLYIIQLVLNFIWPLIFFNQKSYSISFIIIVLLWYTILRMIIIFYQIDKKAALLQIPYIIWVTFASYLNLALALLNQ